MAADGIDGMTLKLAHRMAADEEVQAAKLSHAAGVACRRRWWRVHDVVCNNRIKIARPQIPEL